MDDGQDTVTTLYINQYYEITDTEVTTSYYLGSRLIAVKKGTELNYVHQDHLGSTSVTSGNSGAIASTIAYFSFGVSRNSPQNLSTDRLFTGQRLDGTGLYYYGARYYDPSTGRFISADTIVPDPANPQSLNRYSYCLNNPLKYKDDSGHYYNDYDYEISCAEAGVDPSVGNILVYENGSWVSMGITVNEFVSWVDDTPEPLDYISQSTPQKIANVAAGIAGVGVESIKSYHSSPLANPIPVIIATEGGWVDKNILKAGAVPAVAMAVPYVGILTKTEEGHTLVHESTHIERQNETGEIRWLINYGVEYKVREEIYKALEVSDPSGNAYRYLHEEIIARRAANEHIGTAPGPSWLKRLLCDD